MYLGHMIGKDDVKVHMKNILATLFWPIPKNLIELGEFNLHTTLHIATRKYPFKAGYCYGVPNHLDQIFRGCKVQEAKSWIQKSKGILEETKDKL